MKTLLERIKKDVSIIEAELPKVESGNKAAGVRLRKSLQAISHTTKEFKKESLK